MSPPTGMHSRELLTFITEISILNFNTNTHMLYCHSLRVQVGVHADGRGRDGYDLLRTGSVWVPSQGHEVWACADVPKVGGYVEISDTR